MSLWIEETLGSLTGAGTHIRLWGGTFSEEGTLLHVVRWLNLRKME